MKGLRVVFSALFALVLFSCAKEPVETGEQGGFLRYFAPDIVQKTYNAESVKASVAVPDGTVSFEDGDQVVVSNGSKAVTFRYSAQRNLFFSEGDLPLTGDIRAFYPADYYTSLSEGGNFNVLLPVDQIYMSDRVLKAPMGGSYAAGTMSFKNLCAILSLPLAGESKISRVTFSTGTSYVCGEGLAEASSLTMKEGASRTLALDVSGSSSKTGETVYLVLPSQNYPGGFSLYVQTDDGRSFNYSRDTDLYLAPSCISVTEAIEYTDFSGGKGTAEHPYLISRPEDLIQMRDLFDSEEYAKYSDKHYLQTADIDFANFSSSIRVIGTEEGQEFRGVYDGAGFKIKNGSIIRDHSRVALFGATIGATIKNVHFENCTIPRGGRSMGFVVGIASEGSVIEDCSVTGGSATTTWTGVGSIVGELKSSTVRRCKSSATITGSNGTAYSGAGGIVGYIDNGSSTVSDCEFTGEVKVVYNQEYEVRGHNVGGIVGNIHECASVVENCKFSGKLSGRAGYMGGIVGRSAASSTIRNCTVAASASIEGSSDLSDVPDAIGGVVGALVAHSPYGEVSGCSFAGTLKAYMSWNGGIVGTATGPINVIDCKVLQGASLYSAGAVLGGIVGNSEFATSLGVVRGCSVTSATMASDMWGVGGIVGRNYGLNVSSCSVKSCTITSKGNNAAGISGISRGNIAFNDCVVESCEISATEGTLAAGVVAEITYVEGTRLSVNSCQIKNCEIRGKYYTGGIAGHFKSPAVINQCYVSGTSVASFQGGEAGGILGKTSTSGILVANSMFWGGSIEGSTQTSGIGGIVGSFYSEHGLETGKSLSTTTIVNCMAHPTTLTNTNTASNSALIGGVAGHMAYTRMVNSYSPTPSASMVHKGVASLDKRGSLYGYLDCGGSLTNCYWLEGFTAGLTNTTYTYTSYIQKATDDQMKQIASNNVFWVPSEYPDGDYRKDNMTAALNKGVSLYNAASPLYGIQALSWVKTAGYAYPVLAGSPLDSGAGSVVKKKVGIIGDSISTFKDWSNSVNNYQYPKSEYETFTVQDTYWYQLIYNKMTNAVLDVNTSYCGSTVQNNAEKGKPSFISRYSDLRNPDIIFINGGTNDSWSYKLPVGTLDFDIALENLDTYQFAQAYDKLIRLLKRDHPSAQIFLIIGDCLRDYPAYTKVITDLAAHYNLKYAQITFSNRASMTYQRTGTSDINVHPNIAGMKEMANQIYDQLKNYL